MWLQCRVTRAFCALVVLVAALLAGGCARIIGLEDVPLPDPDQDASVDGSRGVGGANTGGTDTGPGGCGDTSNDVKNCGACGHDCTAVANVGSPASIKCSTGKCVLPPVACAEGYGDCDGDPDNGCETSLHSAEHCGACIKMCPSDVPLCATAVCVAACPASTTQCGTSCVDLDKDLEHCGDCATECSRPAIGGRATCAQKMCSIQCLAGFHTCPGTPDCASDTDAQRCGPMCSACQAPVNGDAVCSNGACATTCRAPYKLCGAACIDTSRDVKNCGACGHDCTALPHLGSTTGVACSAGVCVVPATACSTGFGHCSANADDGCETDITTPAHCQGCSTQCPVDMPVCTAAGCKSQCPPATPTLCGGTCVDLNADAMHCGACTTACAQPTSGGSATCEQKDCVVHCLTGFHACGTTQCASDTDAARCQGPACQACVAPANGTAQCLANKCAPACNPGFHLCSGACVSDLDPLNCGASCTPCPPPSNGVGAAACLAGQCGLNCAPGHACGTGCYSNTDATHCGGPPCTMCLGPTAGSGNAQCTAGACTIACTNGTNCSGACYDLNSDPAHCGSCTHPCSAGQVCLSGTCAIDCGTRTRCGTSCIDTMTDPNNCGMCGNVCPSAGPNGTVSCVGGMCKNTCNGSPPQPLCNNQCPNLQSDVQNCGMCGTSCGGGVCSAGMCCPQGQYNSAGLCCTTGTSNSNGICCPTTQYNSGNMCCNLGPPLLTNCSNTCVDMATSTNNCGSCGHVCNTPPATTCVNNGTTRRTFAATGTCSGSSCGYAWTDTPCPGNNLQNTRPTCNTPGAACGLLCEDNLPPAAGLPTCSGAARCLLWNFESVTVDDWAALSGGTLLGPVTKTLGGNSTHLLAVNVPAGAGRLTMQLSLCQGGMAINDRLFTFRVYAEGSTPSGGAFAVFPTGLGNVPGEEVDTPNGVGGFANQWIEDTESFFQHSTILLQLIVLTPQDWGGGTIYFDDIQWH